MTSKALTVAPRMSSPVPVDLALGGINGGQSTSRETALWRPSTVSPDQAINLVKTVADARATDMAVNDPLSQHAVRVNRNSIVGAMYRLNAKPNYRVIYGNDSDAAVEYGEELAAVVEARFNLAAESENCYFDAGGMMTFTDMVRLAVGSATLTGEAFGAVEWEDHRDRPFNTCIQMVSPSRVRNKNGLPDANYPDGSKLRRGIYMTRSGRPISFQVSKGHPSEFYDLRADEFVEVPAELKWGRKQMIFIREALQIDQTRGLSEMVAALSHIKMTKNFSEITLQNAVINASYAASIESELPPAEIFAAMGGGPEGFESAVGKYLSMLQSYLGASDNIVIDGAKIPTFFPGTKMRMQPMGTPGGVGSDFHAALIRNVAIALGQSPADLSRDFSRTNYSGLKGELALAERDTNVRKRAWADRWATGVYRLWFEEEMAAGNLPLPPGRNRSDFYRGGGLMKDAYTQCTWIGSGRGQIDEPKETAAALARIDGGLSTYEKECARLGEDFREIFAQRRKEERLARTYGIPLVRSAAQTQLEAAKLAAVEQPDDDDEEDDIDDRANEGEEE